jgi:alpha,alpha-trehalase
MPSSSRSTCDLVPADQLGFTEAQLPDQLLRGVQGNGNATATVPGVDMNKLNGTVVNGKHATSGEGWRDTLQMANRYYASYDIRARIFS